MRSASRKTITLGIVATLSLFSASAFAVDHAVTVGVVVGGGFTFSPSTLTIAAGDTVTWNNPGGSAPHNTRSDAGSVTNFRCANGCDGAGGNGTPSAAAWTATVTFPTPGTIPYYCEIHGGPGGVGMHGSITVTTPVDLQSFEID
ncbi:MAG TPA: plastocyanin/azurin family copper-binding protein [Rhodanobacteraceae bacterium]|jgi:plastocyanin|nr:plastocyanin/azurin family copper-binding protein [Rhodanobacteraceae bacterium]